MDPRFGMMRTGLWFAASLLLLAACGPVRHINPPAVSIQEMQAPDSGAWTVALRVENFSNVPMRFVDIGMLLEVDGRAAGRVEARPDMVIPGESADVVEVSLTPSAEARAALAQMATGTRPNLAYVLRGDVRTEEPNDEFEIEHSSRLSPVPGRPGVYR